MTPESISNWSEFGLAGMVIAVLFASLFVVVKWLIAHIDKQAERHQEERSEWRDSNNEVMRKVEQAVVEISHNIKTLANKD